MRKGRKGRQGKNKRKAQEKRRNQKNSNATPEDIEFFETFKMLNGPISEPFKYYTEYDDNYVFHIISSEWFNAYQEYIEGKKPAPPVGDINEGLINKNVPENEKFYWRKRDACNTYLKKGSKFKKHYYAVTEASWDLLCDKYPSSSLFWMFELTKKGFVSTYSSLESVRFWYFLLIYLQEILPEIVFKLEFLHF